VRERIGWDGMGWDEEEEYLRYLIDVSKNSER
jgi:hypothetical protein